jgi:hypothetical protein
MKAAEVLVLQGASTGLYWNASSMGLSFYLHSKDKKQIHRIFLIIFLILQPNINPSFPSPSPELISQFNIHPSSHLFSQTPSSIHNPFPHLNLTHKNPDIIKIYHSPTSSNRNILK